MTTLSCRFADDQQRRKRAVPAVVLQQIGIMSTDFRDKSTEKQIQKTERQTEANAKPRSGDERPKNPEQTVARMSLGFGFCEESERQP